MSGIVGVLNLNGDPVDRDTLARMCEAVKHRGPNKQGLWAEGAVGFGHVLLHTTPESLSEKQPLSLDGTTWITADARIDDREGLIDRLKGRDVSSDALRQSNDVELLLRAYHRWGIACVNHLIGVFATVIWDGRIQELICLRDHIGVKPFYYARTPEHFVFASEVKGILASGLVPQRIYEPRVADFLVTRLEGVDKTCTFFEGICRLPPAHRMRVGGSMVDIQEYWKLNPSKEIRFKNPHDYIEAFHDVFNKAVDARLRGHKPVASMLSGGLDSSIIVAAARDRLTQKKAARLPTFSMTNNHDPGCRETFFIKKVLDQGEFNAQTIDITDYLDYADDIEKLLQVTDDPFDVGMDVPQTMYIAAHRKGCTAMLDGVDGDLVMGQPGNHVAWLFQQFRFVEAIHEAKKTCEFFHGLSGNLYHDIFQGAKQAFTPMFLRKIRRRLRYSSPEKKLDEMIKKTIINRDFAHRVDLPGRIKKLNSHSKTRRQIDLRQLHANALNHPYLVVALERYDRVASVYSIEPRHPILDKRVVEFCLALPWDQKIRDGWTKITARLAMEKSLPDEVIWRKGFEHLGGWMTHYLLWNERTRLTTSILKKLDHLSPYVDTGLVEGACHDYALSNDQDYSHTRSVKEAKILIAFIDKFGQGG